jgi:hypothetical protein
LRYARGQITHQTVLLNVAAGLDSIASAQDRTKGAVNRQERALVAARWVLAAGALAAGGWGRSSLGRPGLGKDNVSFRPIACFSMHSKVEEGMIGEDSRASPSRGGQHPWPWQRWRGWRKRWRSSF